MSIVVINAVGLTPNLLPYAPQLKRLAENQWQIAMRDILPAVTCSVQATLLTGKPVHEHGIVGNGWLYRDTQEVRFWQQSNHLLQKEPLYVTARKRANKKGKEFRCAKLFWWFNQGAMVDYSITPKPYYGIDGSKVFGITGTPDSLAEEAEKKLGVFPFHTFWGPMAGLPSTEWIAKSAAWVMESKKPDLTLVYLPHLDYDPQRFGPDRCHLPQLVKELDDACSPILETANRLGVKVWVLSEYGHCSVRRAIYLNRILREEKYLKVRTGPFGDQLDLFVSRAFAVCDHQLAHIYVKDENDVDGVKKCLQGIPGVAKLYSGEERNAICLNHVRSGEIIALSEQDSWFAYNFWFEDSRAPDYARCVAIHHKPGYDPCELFVDPTIWFPQMKIARKLLQKKIGFRMMLDVIPLEASIVRGSHGLINNSLNEGPILIGTGRKPNEGMEMTEFKELLLQELGL